MFTGLIDGTARLEKICDSAGCQMSRFYVANSLRYDFDVGDSIAVNGCCLTVTRESDEDCLVFEVSRETLDVTNLGDLQVGEALNLERAMRLSDRLDGHLVSGHVDTTAEVTRVDADPTGWLLQIKIANENKNYVIPKGSICLNGVSLTINKLIDQDDMTFLEFMLIPTTLEKTNLKGLRPGSKLNVEFDLVGKYILRTQK